MQFDSHILRASIFSMAISLSILANLLMNGNFSTQHIVPERCVFDQLKHTRLENPKKSHSRPHQHQLDTQQI